MKKLFLALMAVAAIAMVSCDRHQDEPATPEAVQTDSVTDGFAGADRWDKTEAPVH